jgi:hypothetical protein
MIFRLPHLARSRTVRRALGLTVVVVGVGIAMAVGGGRASAADRCAVSIGEADAVTLAQPAFTPLFPAPPAGYHIYSVSGFGGRSLQLTYADDRCAEFVVTERTVRSSSGFVTAGAEALALRGLRWHVLPAVPSRFSVGLTRHFGPLSVELRPENAPRHVVLTAAAGFAGIEG